MLLIDLHVDFALFVDKKYGSIISQKRYGSRSGAETKDECQGMDI